jgi:Ca2+-binding EF-hand superfamily protein
VQKKWHEPWTSDELEQTFRIFDMENNNEIKPNELRQTLESVKVFINEQ